MTETYLLLTAGHKVRILQERLLELEAEHFRTGVLGEEALALDSQEGAVGAMERRVNVDSAMAVVRARLDALTSPPEESVDALASPLEEPDPS